MADSEKTQFGGSIISHILKLHAAAERDDDADLAAEGAAGYKSRAHAQQDSVGHCTRARQVIIPSLAGLSRG